MEKALSVLLTMCPEANDAEDELRYLASMLASTETSSLMELHEDVAEMLEVATLPTCTLILAFFALVSRDAGLLVPHNSQHSSCFR